MGTLRLRAGRVKPLWLGHPWVFAQAVESVQGAPGPGDVVLVQDPEGNVLGRGFYSPKSAIVTRLITRGPDEALDEGALVRRLEEARRRRQSFGFPSAETTGYRLVHAEGDELPGLIVDVFGDTAVLQIGTAGMKRHEAFLVGQVERLLDVRRVIRAAGDFKSTEGFKHDRALLRGEGDYDMSFAERGFKFEVPGELQQKTGFYFDQRESRARVEGLAKGRRVLDAFAYLGGFSLAAHRGGASSVSAFDSSSPAVAAAAHVARKNGAQIDFQVADAKKFLPELIKRGEKYDMVIVDPPKLIPTRRHVRRGTRAYQTLNERAMKLVAPGGVLVSCSCSGALSPRDFRNVLAEAAASSGRRATLLSTEGAPVDHATPIAFREGRYLKAAFMLID